MFNNSTLVIDNIEINIDNRFRRLDGLRILHFSDMHLNRSDKRFDNFFASLGEIECDLAICSGDMINSDKGIDACVGYLAGLKPKRGIFTTYGNHDRYKLGFKEVIFFPLIKRYVQKNLDFPAKNDKVMPNNLDLLEGKLRNKGINVLNNDLARLDINGSGVGLIGIGINSPLGYYDIMDPGKFKSEIEKLNNVIGRAFNEDYIILISHIPDLIKDVNTKDVNLILSSHTHGGQIRFPFFGPITFISSFQRKYCMGIFRYNNSYLHVNSGLGATSGVSVRFRCPPRAAVITLKSNTEERHS